MHKILFCNKFISCLYMFRATCAHRQEVKIVLYSLWYHHTYRGDDTRDCIIQFCPPDYEHMCSKHVEVWNKLIIKFSASSWLILRDKYIEMHGQKNTKILLNCLCCRSFYTICVICTLTVWQLLINFVFFCACCLLLRVVYSTSGSWNTTGWIP